VDEEPRSPLPSRADWLRNPGSNASRGCPALLASARVPNRRCPFLALFEPPLAADPRHSGLTETDCKLLASLENAVWAPSTTLPFKPARNAEFHKQPEGGTSESTTSFARKRQGVATQGVATRHAPTRDSVGLRAGDSVRAASTGQDIGREGLTAGNETDYRVELPVSTLMRGEYLLEISANDGRATTRSELCFRRR
jgi:hypothetical protein